MQRLPPEALMHIFLHIRPTLEHFGRVRNMMAVCRRWKNIILRTPQFWADLIEGSPWRFYGFYSIALDADVWRRFQIAVNHAGHLPFHLYMTCIDDAVVDFLFPHRDRITTLVLSQKTPHIHGPGINRLVSAGLPGLVRLSIAYLDFDETYYDPPDSRMAYPRISSILMPRLRTLELPGYHFAENGPLLSLRHLTLTTCGWESWCSCGSQSRTLDTLLQVLEQCLELETLAIQDVPATDEVDPTNRVVRLNTLRNLRVEGTAKSVSTYLTHLVFPPTISLHLSITPRDGTFLDVLPPGLQVAMLEAYDIQSVHFRGVPRTCSVEIHGAHGQEMRIIEHRDEHVVEGCDGQLLQTVGLFSHAHRVEVELHGAHAADVDTLQEVWSTFRPLRSFKMVDWDARLVLLPFVTSREGRQSLRALEHLSITWDWLCDAQVRSCSNRQDLSPYNAAACEAFCDLLAPVLASVPFANSLQTLEVLISPSWKDRNAVQVAAVQGLLHGRLGRLVQELTVALYDRRIIRQRTMATWLP